MSGESQTSSSSSTGMTKPNCTIRGRQDDLLEELAKGRFASRSEALRTAIEELHQSVTEDDDTVYERIIGRIGEVANNIQEIQNQLDDIEDSVQEYPGQAGQLRQEQAESGIKTAVEATPTASLSEVENDVFGQLLDNWPQTIPELAASIEVPKLTVRESLEILRDRDYITQMSGETEQPAYRPTDVDIE